MARSDGYDGPVPDLAARDVVTALFGPKARISLGTVAAMEKRTTAALRPVYDEALDAIQNADFVHCDETSWRQENRLSWLWAAVTPKLKVFRIDPRRNREAYRRLLFAFDGILVTDRYSVYRVHDTEMRAAAGGRPRPSLVVA